MSCASGVRPRHGVSWSVMRGGGSGRSKGLRPTAAVTEPRRPRFRSADRYCRSWASDAAMYSDYCASFRHRSPECGRSTPKRRTAVGTNGSSVEVPRSSPGSSAAPTGPNGRPPGGPTTSRGGRRRGRSRAPAREPCRTVPAALARGRTDRRRTGRRRWGPRTPRSPPPVTSPGRSSHIRAPVGSRAFHRFNPLDDGRRGRKNSSMRRTAPDVALRTRIY